MIATAKLDQAGRILIPVRIRRELGLAGQAGLVLRVEKGELRIHTRAAALGAARERLRTLKGPGKPVVEELLAERKAETRRERKRWGR